MKYTQKIADSICEQISDGMSLSEICEKSGAPSYSNIMLWLRQNDAFREEYAMARQAQAQKHFDELADLERSCVEGSIEPSVFRAVLDSRKWRLARALAGNDEGKTGLEGEEPNLAELLQQRLGDS